MQKGFILLNEHLIWNVILIFATELSSLTKMKCIDQNPTNNDMIGFILFDLPFFSFSHAHTARGCIKVID